MTTTQVDLAPGRTVGTEDVLLTVDNLDVSFGGGRERCTPSGVSAMRCGAARRWASSVNRVRASR